MPGVIGVARLSVLARDRNLRSLFTYKVSQNERTQGKHANPIFSLELFTADTALWALGNKARDASILVFVDNDSASQVLTKGGSNHPLISRLVGSSWFLVARESVSIWPVGVCASSNPADAPGGDLG